MWTSIYKFLTHVQAMYQLSSTARQLAEQKATLEGQRRAHLAWSGQAMVSNSLNVMQEVILCLYCWFLCFQCMGGTFAASKAMQEAVETIRNAFLLPLI